MTRFPGLSLRRAPSRDGLRALAAAALLSTAAAACAQDPLLDRAAALMAQRDPAAAYQSLAGEEAQRAGDPRFDYLLGVSALDSGHYTRAIFALERAVETRPDDALARAELARAYLAAGEIDNGRTELQRVRSTPLADDAAAAIDRVLGLVNQVAPQTGLQFSGYLEVGGGRDSNVNSATNQSEFAVPSFGGLLFATSPENQRQHDYFATAAAGGVAQFALAPEWKLLGAANLRGTANHRVHDMNTDLLDVTAGVNHVTGLQSQTVVLQNSTAWVGSRVYRTANGASAQWQSQLDAASQASVFAQWSRQEYAGQSDRNTDRSVLGAGYARDFGTLGSLVFGSVYLADERARHEDAAYFGHHALGARAGVEQRVGTAGVLAFEWQHERRRYGATEPLFEVGRRDRQDDLSLQFRAGSKEGWQVVPQIRYTRAASNVVLYDYRRTVFQLTVRRDF